MDQYDQRDRFSTETTAYKYLWENGIRSIPKLIKADRKRGYILFQYISGEIIETVHIRKEDIDQAVAFLSKLRGLALKTGSTVLPDASEASFTVAGIIANLEARLARLYDVESNRQLELFLKQEFRPTYDSVIAKTILSLEKSDIAFDDPIDKKNKTLSPSDFGFHNAVKDSNGKIYFFDFEYFGWDDPAKTIADFMLHPAMQLSDSMRHYFYCEALQAFRDIKSLEQRIQIVCPLYVIKWCLIILNEFLPDRIARREFVGDNLLDIKKIQSEQLVKAQQMLKKVVNTDA